MGFKMILGAVKKKKKNNEYTEFIYETPNRCYTYSKSRRYNIINL